MLLPKPEFISNLKNYINVFATGLSETGLREGAGVVLPDLLNFRRKDFSDI